ncbi:hypothetical protein H7J50_20055 [Mycobacterium intermedium]|uniref:hypothetical protein n=1 Tax=Mycobacterium intermedium TaxID=28445 RepID=UPI0012EAAFAA|nr:hypothetical protein [Mycobacterium intermedium]MCV6966084.1 hypothetical protein [Mycobacterium intermedium]
MTITWRTGEAAAELTGASIAETDAAAASGRLDAQYHGWQLMVATPPTKPRKATRKAKK